MKLRLFWGICFSLSLLTNPCLARAEFTKEQARDALHRAVRFFREKASASGSYVYRLSADLQKREGEGKVGPHTGWIENPGTPAVGMAYLNAYQLTGDPLLLEAALETGMALVNTQLMSGGWDNGIYFAPEDRARMAYRVDGHKSVGRLSNTTTFDDDKSQLSLRFLMQLDRVLEFRNETIHEAVVYAQNAFLKAQYPNGAWPQRYNQFPDPDKFPIKKASFPDEWPRTFPGVNYAGFYTINDSTISDVIATMLDAWHVTGDERFLEAAQRGGEFFILAQLPDPQPGWAQQYNFDMHPVWARKFEPPAVTGGESQQVMRMLLRLYQETGEERYLEPIPRALAYYRRSLLPDGRLARFYELKTNRPLYFTKDYQLTHSSDDMPTHYSFIVGSRLDTIERDYQRLRERRRPWSPSFIPSKPKLTEDLRQQAEKVAAALDDRGAWVEAGRLRYHGEDDTRRIIASQTFMDNLDILARFLAAE